MLNPLGVPRLKGISRFAREHGWNIMLENRRTPDLDFPDCDGVLATLRGGKVELRMVAVLRRRGIPVVDLTIACPRLKLPRVVSNHFAIGRLAARHFLDRGFEQFAWFSAGWSNVHRLRYEGFAADLPRKPLRLSLDHVADHLKSAPKPLAVLTYDEIDAARALSICRANMLAVPEDVSILGIGNDEFLCESQSITISSIESRLEENAYRGAELLQRLMDGERAPDEPILLQPSGVIARASTETLAHRNPVVRAALVYIHRNLGKPLGSTETAAAVGISRSRLDALFAKEVGHSVGREIIRQRMLRAKRLLKDPAVPVKNIAAVCGFCDTAYFSNVFSRETGLSPRSYRTSGAPQFP